MPYPSHGAGVHGLISIFRSLKPNQVLGVLAGTAALVIAGGFYFHRRAIKRILKQSQDSLLFGVVRMKRVPLSTSDTESRKIPLLALSPKFLEEQKDQFRMLSLGDYLVSLHPVVEGTNAKLPKEEWIQNEIRAGLATGLVRILGPSFGRAMLPAIGLGSINTLVHNIAGRVISHYHRGSVNSVIDRGVIPITILHLSGLSDANSDITINNRQKNQEKDDGKRKETKLSPIVKMKLGEAGYTPSFASLGKDRSNPSAPQKPPLRNNGDKKVVNSIQKEERLLVPNPFIIEKHWESAILSMEELIKESNEDHRPRTSEEEVASRRGDVDFDDAQEPSKPPPYDPKGREWSPPTPVGSRIFPGLHVGWGDAVCTHSHRQVLRQRLFSVLLNRLGSNYYYSLHNKNDKSFQPFVVQMNGKDLTAPDDFIQALLDSGHSVKVNVTTRLTSFGVGLCVKEEPEEDQTAERSNKTNVDHKIAWTHIPLACVVHSGYETADQSHVPVVSCHSGLNMDITGPLLGQEDGEMCNLQQYISIAGYAGWNSDHNPVVPWIERIPCGKVFEGKDSIRAVRLGGLLCVVLNVVASDLGLPFGGYGLTGVCNDSASIMQYALTGNTDIFPLTSVGRYAMHTIRYARKFRDQLLAQPGMEQEVADLNAIITAMKSVPSDLHASPANVKDAGRRILHSFPSGMPFELHYRSRDLMTALCNEEANDD